MKTYTCRGLSILFFLCLPLFLQAQNVIIVVVDGARYSETFGGGNSYIPHLFDDMKPLGTFYTNYRINYPAGFTKTCPGHSAIVSGTWQPIVNDGSERPTRPTIFEYIRKEYGNPQSDCYALTGKTKLDILNYSTYPGYGSEYGGTWIGDDNKSDSLTYSKVIATMQNYHPKILVINFAEVDEAGHSGNWNYYFSAITNADNYVYQLWQHIQAGDYGYTTSNTTMFITNDHGRHDDAHGGFTDHGDGCEGCIHIMLLALGRNVTANRTSDVATWQIDIAPTVGELLGFPTSLCTGSSLLQDPNTGVETIKGTMPDHYEIYQNFPNPFNPSTIIRYALQSESKITITVYNILGQEIKQLLNTTESAGYKELNFNASNLASGVYFYRITSISTDGKKEFADTKKLLLLK